MSDYESHSGKLRIVEPKENETLEQLKKRIWVEKGNEEEDYEVTGNLSDDYYNEFFEVNGKIWKVVEHEDLGDEDDMFCRLQDNKDGTFYFHTRFYNGGTCMSEMVTEALDRQRIKRKAISLVKKLSALPELERNYVIKRVQENFI